jgi:hypothetical protein
MNSARVTRSREAEGESRVRIRSGNAADEIGLVVVQADLFAESSEREQRRASPIWHGMARNFDDCSKN